MFHIQQIDLENYSIIVYSSSYDSLLSYLLDIEQKIKELGITQGYILFDTLLSKGNNSTRFLKQNLKMANLLNHLFKILKLLKIQKLGEKLVNFIENLK